MPGRPGSTLHCVVCRIPAAMAPLQRQYIQSIFIATMTCGLNQPVQSQSRGNKLIASYYHIVTHATCGESTSVMYQWNVHIFQFRSFIRSALSAKNCSHMSADEQIVPLGAESNECRIQRLYYSPVESLVTPSIHDSVVQTSSNSCGRCVRVNAFQCVSASVPCLWH